VQRGFGCFLGLRFEEEKRFVSLGGALLSEYAEYRSLTMALDPRERTRFLYSWCPVARKDAQPTCKCRRSSKWKSYRIR
jgi:hypothetical protein